MSDSMSQHSVRNVFRACPAPARAALEKWSRGRVVRRRMGSEFGGRAFYASPEAALFWAYPWASAAIDEELMNFCREFVRPGSVVWDFGGHLGIFAFAAAHRAGAEGMVLSVEPDPFLSRLMIRTEAERPSGVASCTVLTCAVGRAPGFATLEIPERSRAANALAGKSQSTQRGGIRERFDVPVVTVSQLASRYPSPTVIKMDIEGS
jgi:FkbM family methyltransferase